MKPAFDRERCENLVLGVVRGESDDWAQLVALLGPALLEFARGARSLGHRRSEDDLSEVMTAVLERLRKSDFRALRTYLAWRDDPANETKTIEDWLRIVTDRVACDYVGYRARRSVVNTLGAALDSGTPANAFRPAMTDAQAVRELLEHARREFPADQIAALEQAFEGQSAEEIAGTLGVKRSEVEKRLRAAHARLRRWVDDGEGGDGPSAPR